MTKQRLRKKELVSIVFQLFWEEAHRLHRSSMQGITIPLDRMREELARRTGSPRQNSKWIHTQIRRYEEREGVVLFQKVRDEHGQPALQVTERILSFVQKRHLHRAEKIRVAHGVVDYVERGLSVAGRPIRILLGAGTTMELVAEVLRDRVADTGLSVEVTTHNIGVIGVLSGPPIMDDRRVVAGSTVSLRAMGGRFDPATYSFVTEQYRWETPFDLVVQGASAVHDGTVFIESATELPCKHSILHETEGEKLLALTLHEFRHDYPDTMVAFGVLSDFDLIVMPKVKQPLENQSAASQYLHGPGAPFASLITGWHYEILARSPVSAASALRDREGRHMPMEK